MPTISPVLTFCLLGGVFAGLLVVVFKIRHRKTREKRIAACYSSPTMDCLLVLAVETAKGIRGMGFSNTVERARALADIAGVQAETGDVTGALETIATNGKYFNQWGREKAKALTDIAGVQAKAGDVAGALETARDALEMARKSTTHTSAQAICVTLPLCRLGRETSLARWRQLGESTTRGAARKLWL